MQFLIWTVAVYFAIGVLFAIYSGLVLVPRNPEVVKEIRKEGTPAWVLFYSVTVVFWPYAVLPDIVTATADAIRWASNRIARNE